MNTLQFAPRPAAAVAAAAGAPTAAANAPSPDLQEARAAIDAARARRAAADRLLGEFSLEDARNGGGQ